MAKYYWVYLLACWNNPKSMEKRRPKHGHIIYTGYTNDVARRFYEHLTGKRYSKRPTYTSQFEGNIRLIFVEIYDDKKEAEDREDEIKTFSRDEKIKLVQELEDNFIEFIEKINHEVIIKIKK